MQALITYLAKALVDQPDQVELREVRTAEGIALELKVAPSDIGKVIGRDGRTVNAMRTLLAAVAQKHGEKVRLEVIDGRKPAEAAAPEPAP